MYMGFTVLTEDLHFPGMSNDSWLLNPIVSGVFKCRHEYKGRNK